MKVIKQKVLEDFWKKHAEVRSQCERWLTEVEDAVWKNWHELKERYRDASIIGDDLVVFNLKGKKYRLTAKIIFKRNLVLIEKMETHTEYSKRIKKES